MQNASQGSSKKSYRGLLLSVVALAAISNAVKEVNQMREVTRQTTSFLAQVRDAFAPAVEPTIRVETCQNRRMSPPPLPVTPPVAPVPAVESDVNEVEVPEVAPVPPTPPAAAVPSVPKVREIPQPRRVCPAHSPAEVKVLVSTDDFEKSIKDAFVADQSFKALRTKNRRFIFATPDGRDMILKTLNRSLNLRSAS